MSFALKIARFDASPPLFIAVIIFSRTDLALAIAPSRIDGGSLTDSGSHHSNAPIKPESQSILSKKIAHLLSLFRPNARHGVTISREYEILRPITHAPRSKFSYRCAANPM
jgi:hypothetical protein